ncbi:uncharacterized protein LOC114929495 [Nylanderia fulva]|uniref:uncharacterized protein LOC114929495 n=1 Tax=Nylanderia fulva TaxID=613905 RepID=UPI0010FB803F|nr:uncharacterized protein LOC114929495 [Nylanderia fulva]
MDSVSNGLICKFILLLICICYISIVSSEIKDMKELISKTGISKENLELGTIAEPIRQSKAYRSKDYSTRGDNTDYQDHYSDDTMNHDDENDHSDMKAISQPKVVDYWAGYYDFLINEGSYKFWAVFQLATAALLIYSGFAALYYAKVNPPTTDDYFDDIFRRRRRRRRRRSLSCELAAPDRSFAGLDATTFQRIIQALDAEHIDCFNHSFNVKRRTH